MSGGPLAPNGIAAAMQEWQRASTYAVEPQGAAEKFFDSLGMMRGGSAPVMRAGFGFALGTAAMFAVRPPCSFDVSSGRPLTWDETATPWWAVPAALSLVFGLLI